MSYNNVLVALVGTAPIDVKNNQSLGHTFGTWQPLFEMCVDIYINEFPSQYPLANGTLFRPYGALFSFFKNTNDGSADVCCTPGTRVPAVFTAEDSDNTLDIAMNGVGDGPTVIRTGEVPTKQWFKLCISQTFRLVIESLKYHR